MNRRVLALVALVGILAVACKAVPYDYTGDKKADPVYRAYPSNDWYRVGQPTPLLIGQPGDIAVSGDYDGNGTWEAAVLRGSDWVSAEVPTPIHYAPRLPTGHVGVPWGYPSTLAMPSVIPVPADYDGDGDTDPAYYSQVNGTWWIKGQPGKVAFGVPPKDGGTMLWDVPVPADYDGDGKADIAIYRPSDSTFRIRSTGQVVQVGSPGDVPVPADYDGDGKADPATYRILTGEWLIAGRTDPIVIPLSGPSGSGNPAPADYDGDGRVDPAQIDSNTGTWTVYGQGTIGTIPDAWTGNAANLAPYAELNLVRLTFAYQCIHQPVGDHCPGNP